MQLFKDAIALVRENMALFFGIVAVPLAFSSLAAFFAPAENTGVVDPTEWGLYAVLFLIGFILNIFMGIAMVKALDNRALTVKGAYSAAVPYFFKYLGASFLSGFLMLIGFILLIVPGIILSVWFAFVFFILVLENAGIVESLKRSREYVRGHWWETFGRLVTMTVVTLLVVFLISLPVAFLLGEVGSMIYEIVMNILVVPVLFAYLYFMYLDIKGGTVAAPAPMATPSVQ